MTAAKRCIATLPLALCLFTVAVQASPPKSTPHQPTLVAVARLAHDSRDALGDTVGSMSAVAVESWSAHADGSYSGKLLLLPDRGYNRPSDRFFSDYAARLQVLDLTLSAPVPSARSATLAYTETRLLRLPDGSTLTGLDPARERVELPAGSLPLNATALTFPGSKGRISFDGEGIARLSNGSYYVSDEYGPMILHFGADNTLLGSLPVPPPLLPRLDGDLNFSSIIENTTGRRGNQGIEGLSVSPCETRLFALTQSAVMQDSGGGHSGRRQARLLVYDLTSGPVPAAPSSHFLLELPVHGETPGARPTRTAAQSALLALSSDTFLVLARDGYGFGDGGAQRPVFKQIVRYRLSAGATDLSTLPAGTKPDGQAAEKGVPLAGITPLRPAPFLDLLEETRLGTFGIRLASGEEAPALLARGQLPLSEKWEALALAPTRRPGIYFLLVGNDNDFQTTQGQSGGRAYNAGADHDTVILVYEINLSAALR